jgi:SAM-dependent methyltransferase
MTVPVQTRLQVPPHAIVRYLFGPWAMQALKTALELKLFTALADGPQTADAVARRLNADSRGTEVLLDALSAMELLEKQADTYRLTEAARLYLLPQSELYLGPYIDMQAELGKLWENLAAAVKSGTSPACVNQQEKGEMFFPQLAAAIFPLNFTTAQSVAEKLRVEALPKDARILDLAAGAAVWSIPMAQRHGGLQVDALDFPATLATTRTFVEQYGLADRYHYLTGRWQDVELPENAYDLILLGHILHSEGRTESERLIENMKKALKPGGRLVIAEFLTSADRTAPMFALLFGLNMLLATERGCVFSEAELTGLLARQGYVEPERLDLPFYEQGSPILTAKKSL